MTLHSLNDVIGVESTIIKSKSSIRRGKLINRIQVSHLLMYSLLSKASRTHV